MARSTCSSPRRAPPTRCYCAVRTPADTIVIRDKTPKVVEASFDGPGRSRTGNPIRAMKALLVADGYGPGAAGDPGRRDPSLGPPVDRGALLAGASVRRTRPDRRSTCCRTSAMAPWFWPNRSSIARPRRRRRRRQYRQHNLRPARKHRVLRDPPRRGAMTTPQLPFQSPAWPAATPVAASVAEPLPGNANTPCSALCWPAASGCSG